MNFKAPWFNVSPSLTEPLKASIIQNLSGIHIQDTEKWPAKAPASVLSAILNYIHSFISGKIYVKEFHQSCELVGSNRFDKIILENDQYKITIEDKEAIARQGIPMQYSTISPYYGSYGRFI